MHLEAFIRLTIVLLATGAIGVVGAVVVTAVSILRPPRMNDGKAVYRLNRLSPGDLGLPFEDEVFAVEPKLRLTAWWIPAAGSVDTAILIHGYADAKVGAIAWAPLLHALGLNVLAVDLRRHGQSDGAFATGGVRERADISGLIDQLKKSRPDQTRRVILFGISTGAAVAAAAAAERADIAAVILESPFTDYRSATARHAKLSGSPGGFVLTAAVWLAQKIAQADFKSARPIVTIPQIKCPVLAIMGAEDALLTDADREQMRNVIGGPPNKCWIVPNAPHLLAMHTDPAGYAERVEKLLAEVSSPVSF